MGKGCGGTGRWGFAEWGVRFPRRVLVVTGVLCVLFGCAAAGLADRLSVGGLAASGTPSARAEAWAARYGAGSPELVLVVRPVSPRNALDGPAVRVAGRRLTERLAAEEGVAGVRSYWAADVDDAHGPRGSDQIRVLARDPARGRDRGRAAGLRSRDGRAALVLVDLEGSETETARTAERVVPRYTREVGPLAIRATGPAWSLAQSTVQARTDLLRAELIAAPLTFVILALAFRSLVAALLPVLVGGVAAVGALAVLWVLTAVTDVSVFAVNLIGALGFGLAVDYALFIVARFREEQARGRTAQEAARAGVATAGRTVAVSAGTVTAALAALLVFPFSFLRSMAYAGMVVVVLAALTAVFVLPAVLVRWGSRVTALDPLGRFRWAPAPTIGGDSPLWGTVARAVTRRPVGWGAACMVVLAALVLPFAHGRPGLADERILPAGAESHATADLVRREWGTSAEGTLVAVLPRVDPEADRAALDAYGRRLSALAGVRGEATVTVPATGRYEGGRRVGGEGAYRPETRRRTHTPEVGGGAYTPRLGGAATGPVVRGSVVTLTLRSDPQSERAAALVHAVRRLPAPGGTLHLAGWAAQVVDARAALADRLPLALGLIAAGTMTVVFLFTRSVLIPLKVLAVAALSLSAALGGLVFVFQDGHLRSLLGDFTVTGTIDMTIPLLLFSVAFGLSVDYELFLLSRIQEHYRATGDNTAAIVHGISRTGRLFTAAALAVAVAMGALASSGVLLLKELGIGLALAVVVDATVVRGVLVPSVMRLAGRANWWAPGRGRRDPRPRHGHRNHDGSSVTSGHADVTDLTSPSSRA
ncbi:MMPL family transporter [Streptomyces sp. NRRL S-337]|uniref:MMPL family transporter n=1 Tax=Streptomyces sp. NRRL S-337 TaxID=1463900 RepID=UPI00099C7DEB|nr:MMPL family transporter [Streptomyces sp. NRRL S-337]